MKNIILSQSIDINSAENGIKNRTLIARVNDINEVCEYVVCVNFHEDKWDKGRSFEKIDDAVICYQYYPNIHPHRLSEIATLCIDKLKEEDYNMAMEYFLDTLELNCKECEYFDVDYNELVGDYEY